MPTAPSSSSKSLYCCCGYLCCFFLWAPLGFLFICAQCWGLVRKWGQGCHFGPRSTCNSQKFIFSLKMKRNSQLMANLSICSDWVLCFFGLGGSLCNDSLRSFSGGERRVEERSATRLQKQKKTAPAQQAASPSHLDFFFWNHTAADNYAWDLCRLFSVRCAFTHQAQCSFDLCKSCDWEHRARLSFWESNCCHSSFNLQRTGRLHVAGFEGEKSSPHLPRIVSPPHCAAVEFSLSPLSF